MTQLTPPPQYDSIQPSVLPADEAPTSQPVPPAPQPYPYYGYPQPAGQVDQTPPAPVGQPYPYYQYPQQAAPVEQTPPAPVGQPYQYYQYPSAPARQASNGLGTAGLVTGIIGLVLFWVPVLDVMLGVLATTFGGIGYNKVRQGTATNGGSALAGLVMGAVTLVVAIAFTIWALATG